MQWKHSKLTQTIIAVCWGLYTFLSIYAPHTANAHFHMSEPSIFILRLTIIIPLYFIWSTAARGACNFKQYATLVKTGREGQALNDIATGLLWTLAYLIALSLGGAIIQFFTKSSYYDTLVVLREHIPPILALIGFFLLLRGSHRLRNTAEFTTWTSATFLALAGFALFSILFVLEFSLAEPSLSARTSMNILPRSVLLFTQILPYLVAWFMGILAGLNIAKYAASVKGILYRKAFRNVVLGIWGVVVFSVVLQVLTLASRYLLDLSLAAVVLLIYGVMLLYSLGFLFINSGAKSLTKLEVQ